MTPDSDRMAQEILRALRRITRSMDVSSRQLISARGLSIPQLLCLQHLREYGPLTSGTLARAMALSPPTITGILDRLEMRGLINRERRPEDKRHVLVALTPAGRNLANAAPSSLEKQLGRALSALSPAQCSAIRDAIAQLERMVSDGNEKTSRPEPPDIH
ncbi:MAG TPA: MarR family transcriptional regulator [Gammaproteobacteria bacterium]|nr:MarR family transcriptional regulator [Gammaproteobacteria bacterium]